MKAGRAGVFLLTAVLLTAPAVAQQPVSEPPVSLSVPNPLAGSPPVSLTVPNPLSGLQPGPADLYQSPDASDRFQQGAQYPAPPVIIVPGPYVGTPYFIPYAPYAPYVMQGYRTPVHRVPLPRGALVLETLPDEAQVSVDGYYIGVAQEFGLRGRPLDLVAGPHRIELRAPGYQLLTFSVLIEPNEIVRYRGDMRPVVHAPAPLPRPVVIQSQTPQSVYVIPNCFAGNRPPKGNLPAGCDAKKVETRK